VAGEADAAAAGGLAELGEAELCAGGLGSGELGETVAGAGNGELAVGVAGRAGVAALGAAGGAVNRRSSVPQASVAAMSHAQRTPTLCCRLGSRSAVIDMLTKTPSAHDAMMRATWQAKR